jgi:hypothetical protein
MDGDERENLTRKVEALARTLGQERARHLAGLEPAPALAAVYAVHPEAADMEVVRALRAGGDRALGDQVAAAWAGWRVAPHEEAWRAAEVAARVEGPDGPLPLAEAELALARDPDRARRLLLARAVAEAMEGPARHREAGAEARARTRAEAGLVPDWGAVVEGDQLLGATDDAWQDLLGFFAGREPGLAAVRRGDLRRDDLLHLAAFPRLDGLFRATALGAAVRSAAGDLGLELGRLRIDEAGRPSAWPGARAEGERVVFRRRGGLADWPDLLDALGRALAVALHPRHAPDAVFAAALGGLLSGLCLEPGWLRARLEVERREVPDLLRALGLRRLLGLRAAAAALRVATEVERGLSGQAWREAHREALRAALQAGWDGVRASRDAEAPPLVAAVRGFAAGERLRAALRQQFDEDWWRNPRTREHLAGLLAAGSLHDEEPASAHQAGAALAALLERGQA